MMDFSFSDVPLPVRPDIGVAHERAWGRIGKPGSWWTADERVAIAAEVRQAPRCRLCAESRRALSPHAISGSHERASEVLPEAAVEAVHRIVTDARRLGRSWLEKLAAEGLSDGHYVELVGVVVSVVSIDAFCRGIGSAPHPLPEPEAGLASGILVGLRDRVDRSLAADFTTAGVSHVVAISGWNIAVVAAAVSAPLQRVRRGRRAIAILAVVTAYTLLAGASPSVVRAALMAGVALTAREIGRGGRAASFLALASLAMLLVEPSVIGDAGFRHLAGPRGTSQAGCRRFLGRPSHHQRTECRAPGHGPCVAPPVGPPVGDGRLGCRRSNPAAAGDPAA